MSLAPEAKRFFQSQVYGGGVSFIECSSESVTLLVDNNVWGKFGPKICRQQGRQAERQTDRQADRQIDRQTDLSIVSAQHRRG